MRSPITLGQRPGTVAMAAHGGAATPALPPPPPLPVNIFDTKPFDVANRWSVIPRRDWIMPPILIAKHYSMLVATGASGKSAVSITLALSLVTGRSDLLQLPVDRPCKVILINGEDGAEELTRRVRATCQLFAISLQDIAGRLLIIGARDIPGLTFNSMVRGGAVADPAGLDLLERMVQGAAADVVIIDPLFAFLPGGMNDGAAASAVAGRLTEICVRANCAMLLVHHVSKGSMREGDNDPTAALGSAMWTNHARSVWNARRPNAGEAQEVGQPPSAVKDLLMLLHSKANLSRAEDAIFIELVGVELPNAAPPRHPRGDIVGVARRLTVGTIMGLFSPPTIKAVLDRVATGTASGTPYKASGRQGSQSYKPDLAEVLRGAFPSDTHAAREKLADQLVKQLIDGGSLVKATVTLPRTGGGKGGGKQAEGLLVNWAATQWWAAPGDGAYSTRTSAPQGTST